jgi:hypothetical protein
MQLNVCDIRPFIGRMVSRVSAVALFVVLPTLFAAAPVGAAEAKHSAAGTVSAEIATTKQLPGGAVLHLAPGAKIELGRTMKLQLGPPGSTDTVTQVVKLVSGRVDVDIPLSRIPKTAVLFQAPHKASAVAKGGHSIAIADADRITFAAVDGDMLAASGNDWKNLPSGVVRSFVGNDPTPQEHAVPGVPTLNMPRPMLLALGKQAASVSAEISGVAQAEHYELSLWRVAEKGHELVRRLDARGPSGKIADLEPGHYEVTARAVDSSGIFGKESAARSLRVVGAELPAGARFENGSILLGQRGRVKLLGADGLEASYGASAHFVRAPGTVGLSRGDATVVRLREPGSSDELTLGLEPRTLHAEVSISPKAARWPQDKIDVSVRLFDARGHAVSDTTKVKATVLVDVEPIEVSWARSGNVLSTQVPTAMGRGPWVVRVEIADEFGDPAGRDFLEVAGPDSERLSTR